MALDRTKLSLILALLESDQDGEVVAAAKAIVRMMASQGMRPSDLAQENVLEQQNYALIRASLDSERANVERLKAKLELDRAIFEREKDQFYQERNGTKAPEQAVNYPPTVEQAKNIFDQAFDNGYNNRPIADDEGSAWTTKTSWDDMQRTETLHNMQDPSHWDAFTKTSPRYARWIFMNRTSNTVARQAYAYAWRFGRIHSVQKNAIDLYLKYGR